MVVLGHSNVQQAIALDFSDALRSATLLRPRMGALRPNLVFTPMRIFRQALRIQLPSAVVPRETGGFVFHHTTRTETGKYYGE